ncbi:flagellar filament capping protein FliD [Pseudomonas sp. GOM7]|uniref:flagellar filament capping protein FliD n=1 Tax=unclassified Pseudomonas TaxID=196821 RepID=UPI00227A94E7|nr:MULTISPECIES: flagellar filament capping protein FliD [unclassified Pseudomonas]WAJ36079.1 flagellar filament capping protein FliD [Pseudomonas sp. GOM7]
MAGIPGIGSGIDIKSIVEVLVNAEKAPKTNQLDRLEKQTTTRISAIGTLTGALNTFKSAIDPLNKASLFESRTASTSNSSVVKATATSTAPAGSYNLQVQQLASSSKVALQAVSGGTKATFGGGKLEISAGSSNISVDVTAANNTLAGIRDSINEAGKSSGISASIITDDSGSRLVLSSTKTGQGNDVKVTVPTPPAGAASGDNALSTLAFTATADPDNPGAFLKPNSSTGAGGVITQAKSAKLTIDGLQLERSSNTIEDALEGVTLDLLAAQSSSDLTDGKTISLTVGVDKGSVKSSLQKFVSAYNALISTTSQLTAYVPVDGSAPVTGPLFGDTSVRSLLSGLRNELVSSPNKDGGIQALAELGITTAKDGKLSLDDSKLTDALENNFDQVGAYLTGDNGLMGRLSSFTGTYVATDGVLKQRNDALQVTKQDVDKQRKALDRRVESLQTRLYAQYNAMDSLVGRLKQTSDSLGGMLASLPGFVKKE